MAKIKDVFTLQMGKTPARAKSEYYENGTNKWVSISDLSTYEKYVDDTKEHLTDIAVNESGIKPVPANTVIMSFKLSIGKTAITRESTYTNEAIMAFIPNHPETIIPDYLYYSFSGRDWENGTNRAVMGATLNKATIGELQIDIPDLNRQRAIVERMDKVSELIDLRKKQLAKLDELVKARFVEMFGDAVVNPFGWPVHELQEIVTDDCKISYGIVQTGDDQEDGVPVFRPVDIVNRTPVRSELKKTTEEISSKYKRTILKGRELLITVRANIADTCIVGEEFAGCNVGRGIVPIRTNENVMILEFLKHQLDSQHLNDNIKAMAKGITLIQLNMEDLRTVRLMIPPIEQQKAFVEFAKQLDKSKAVVQQSLAKLETLKKSLMQEYFG